MSEIHLLSSHSTILQRLAEVRGQQTPVGTAPPRIGNDRVEVSEIARLLQQMETLPDTREDLVQRLRTEIGDDAYFSDDKFEVALDRLEEDLLS